MDLDQFPFIRGDLVKIHFLALACDMEDDIPS